MHQPVLFFVPPQKILTISCLCFFVSFWLLSFLLSATRSRMILLQQYSVLQYCRTVLVQYYSSCTAVLQIREDTDHQSYTPPPATYRVHLAFCCCCCSNVSTYRRINNSSCIGTHRLCFREGRVRVPAHMHPACMCRYPAGCWRESPLDFFVSVDSWYHVLLYRYDISLCTYW